MKFFHVYNEKCFKGLEKNGLINKDTGFKMQHAFSVPENMQFNTYAAEGTPLFDLIKSGNYPFYVDRIAGGITYYPYKFDKRLIGKYREMLGDWFLGFQLHESGSNRRFSDWHSIISAMGSKGPYDVEKLKKAIRSSYAKTPDGEPLYNPSHDSPEFYAKLKYSETYSEFLAEMKDMFCRRMEETDGNILPCDSFYLLPKLQHEVGMKTFMPEVGSQIPFMRIAVATARGAARSYGRTWGSYYECWRMSLSPLRFSMPCFNSGSGNEWYLNQQIHPDDFTSYGANGGSSRLLQNRIYYHALMSGADYFSEEWGLNCSYTDMETFELSPYGQVKKDFIKAAENIRDIQAVTPFAIVLPTDYVCVEIPEPFEVEVFANYKVGHHRDLYMRSPLSESEKEYFGHIEDVLKLIYEPSGESYGNEGHILTNSRFGDFFDIIYSDVDESALSRYEYLIDATKDGSFLRSKADKGYKILDSSDIEALEAEIHRLEKDCLPCIVDGLHWLVSMDKNGNNYLTVFNNEGNERDETYGDTVDRNADRTVKVSFRNEAELLKIQGSDNGFKIEKLDPCNYLVTVPAAGFAVMTF